MLPENAYMVLPNRLNYTDSVPVLGVLFLSHATQRRAIFQETLWRSVALSMDAKGSLTVYPLSCISSLYLPMVNIVLFCLM